MNLSKEERERLVNKYKKWSTYPKDWPFESKLLHMGKISVREFRIIRYLKCRLTRCPRMGSSMYYRKNGEIVGRQYFCSKHGVRRIVKGE